MLIQVGYKHFYSKRKKQKRRKESQIPPHASPKHNGAIFMSSKGSRVILFDFILCLPDPLQWGSCLPNTLGRGSCFWDSIRWQSCLHSFAGRLILLPRLWVDLRWSPKPVALPRGFVLWNLDRGSQALYSSAEYSLIYIWAHQNHSWIGQRTWQRSAGNRNSDVEWHKRGSTKVPQDQRAALMVSELPWGSFFHCPGQ